MTVEGLLASLPADRRAALSDVRSVVKKRLPKGYRETVTKGMVIYEVPLEVYPDTYNGNALWYAALASMKGYATLHLLGAYFNEGLHRRLEDGFKKAGKKLNMGKACIRFRASDDLALDVIGDVVAAVPMKAFIATAEAAKKIRKKARKK